MRTNAKSRKQKGGSVSSDLVTGLVPSNCNATNEIQPAQNTSSNFFNNNWANVYKTTGGKRSKRKQNSVQQFDGLIGEMILGGYNGKQIINTVQTVLNEKRGGGHISSFLLNDFAKRQQKKQSGGFVDVSTTGIYPAIGSTLDDYSRYRGTSGDSNMVTGSQMPRTGYQDFLRWFEGQTTLFTPRYGDVLNQPNLQLNCSGNSCRATNVSLPPSPASAVNSVGTIVNLNGNPVDSTAQYQVYPGVDMSYVPPPNVLPQDQRA